MRVFQMIKHDAVKWCMATESIPSTLDRLMDFNVRVWKFTDMAPNRNEPVSDSTCQSLVLFQRMSKLFKSIIKIFLFQCMCLWEVGSSLYASHQNYISLKRLNTGTRWESSCLLESQILIRSAKMQNSVTLLTIFFPVKYNFH